MVNYNQCYWSSDLPSAGASDAFAKQVEEPGPSFTSSIQFLLLLD